MKVWQKQTIRWTVNGKRVERGTANAKRVVYLSKRFYGTLNTFDGRKRQIPLSEDASTSRKILRRLQAVEDEKPANGADRFYDGRQRPLVAKVKRGISHAQLFRPNISKRLTVWRCRSTETE